MRIEKDFAELLQLFDKHKVKYCILGAFAVAFYAEPRYTKDMDILVEPTVDNGRRIIRALNEFGLGHLGLKEVDFCQKEKFFQLGYEPVRVDLLTSIQGMEFNDLWKRRIQGKYGKQKVSFISLNDLIKSKQIANRKQDIADLEKLEQVKIRKKK